MNLARIGNKYLADTEPWKLAKTDMERVGTILNISLQLVANLAIAFEPFLPFSSERLTPDAEHGQLRLVRTGTERPAPCRTSTEQAGIVVRKDRRQPQLKHRYRSCSTQRKPTKRPTTKPNRSAPTSNLTTS